MTVQPAAGTKVELAAGRAMPASIEAEIAVLGAMMLDAAAIGRALESGLREEDFYNPAHHSIFRAMLRLFERRQVVDAITLLEDLRRHGELDRAGGEPYLMDVVASVPTTANVEYHARIVLDNSTKRRLIAVGTRIVGDAYERPEDADTLLDVAEKRIFEIAERRLREGFVPINQLLLRTIELVESLSQNPDRVTGVASGFTDLDHLTAGFQLADLVIVAGRPSMGKCLAHDAEIVLADGSVVTMEEVVRRREAEVLTLHDDWKLRRAPVSNFVDDGVKPVFRVTTRLGRVVETTLSHPFLTVGGWRKLSELAPGDRVAVPRRLPVFGTHRMRDCEVKLLAYLIGDGHLDPAGPTFTNTNPRLLSDFSACVRDFGGVRVRWNIGRGRVPSLSVVADASIVRRRKRAFADRLGRAFAERGATAAQAARATGGTPAAVRNSLVQWLEDRELTGMPAADKHVPKPVFRLEPRALALFLNRIFATDGWACVLANGQPQIGYASVNERLVQQVHHLVLRFGVVASVRRRRIRYGGATRNAWQLEITDLASIRRFGEDIGIYGKEDALFRVLECLGERRHQLAESDVHWDAIVSIEPIGQKQVYDLTVPGTHNFVANDVFVHNTAFALNVAQNASIRHDVPVAIFSLEMSKDQLVQRILCSEARVDAQKMRTGHLSPRDEWQRIVRACDKLQNAKIYIDDTAALSILEMRAKARRLKTEVDLGLVIVDYLQLMEVGTGPVKPENRQQEVSVISRSLKALAKELNVPVLALSQLSRAPEQRTDHRPNLSDLRECVTGDTMVVLTDGRRVPIAELVGTCPSVYAMAPNGKIVRSVADRVWHVGRRPVFEVRLASGRTIRATERHRLYSGSGWRTVGALRTGDRLAIARSIPEPLECRRWSDDRVILLGQLIGDGSYLSNQPMRYTTASEENSRAVTLAAQRAFGSTVTRYAGRGRWHQLMLTGSGNRWHPAGVNRWFRKLGIFGQRSYEKRIPREAFRLPNDQIALLLRHLWATDGSIHLRRYFMDGHRGGIHFSTSSSGLAADVAALLLRLGIVGRTIRVTKQGYRPWYMVRVSGVADNQRFLDTAWAFGPRLDPARALSLVLDGARSNTNVDTLPRQIYERIRESMAKKSITPRNLAQKRGTVYSGNSAWLKSAPSRARVAQYAAILEDDVLMDLATSDLFWDRVVVVTQVGEQDVYDLTVLGTSSWLADGIVSHNSGSLEQDSDLVLFIYREEVYNRNDEKHAGLADIIVGKHRNGPIGSVTLRFSKEFTRFDNYTPRGEF